MTRFRASSSRVQSLGLPTSSHGEHRIAELNLSSSSRLQVFIDENDVVVTWPDGKQSRL